MDKTSLFGLMILACCLTVTLCAPQSKDSQDNDYQGDDYDYNDEDQNGSSQQGTTAITTKHAQPYFPNSKETVAGIIGKEVTLKCDAQNLQADNVIVWYKGDQAVLTKNLFTPNYKLVQNDMVILNATEESQGDYYCHVLPQKIRKHLKVIMGDHPMEAIVPESSTSGSAATYSSALCLAVILSSLRLFQR